MALEGKIISRDGRLHVQVIQPHESEPRVIY